MAPGHRIDSCTWIENLLQVLGQAWMIQASCFLWRAKFLVCCSQHGVPEQEAVHRAEKLWTRIERSTLEIQWFGRADLQILMIHFVGWLSAMPSCSSESTRMNIWQLTLSKPKGKCRMDPSFWPVLLKPNGCQERGGLHILNMTDSHQQKTLTLSLITLWSQAVGHCQLSQWQNPPPWTGLSWQSM